MEININLLLVLLIIGIGFLYTNSTKCQILLKYPKTEHYTNCLNCSNC